MMHYWYWPGNAQGDFWWMGFGLMIIQLIFWIVIIYFAVKLVQKYFNKKDTLRFTEDLALSILRERYAKGEINTEEFNLMKSELEKHS